VLQHSEQIRFGSHVGKTSNVEISNRSLEGGIHIDQVLDEDVSNDHFAITVLVERNTTAALAEDLQQRCEHTDNAYQSQRPPSCHRSRS
jgi:hypothetical protein